MNGCITAGNVLFKTNEDKGVTESVITNFQQARYNTPALDVLLAILLTTNSMLRSNNFESLLVHYYNNFSRELTEHEVDPKAILTWDQFNECTRRIANSSSDGHYVSSSPSITDRENFTYYKIR